MPIIPFTRIHDSLTLTFSLYLFLLPRFQGEEVLFLFLILLNLNIQIQRALAVHRAHLCCILIYAFLYAFLYLPSHLPRLSFSIYFSPIFPFLFLTIAGNDLFTSVWLANIFRDFSKALQTSSFLNLVS